MTQMVTTVTSGKINGRARYSTGDASKVIPNSENSKRPPNSGEDIIYN